MASYSYITSSDVTALVASDFTLSGYINRTNDHVEYIAYSNNVSPTGIYHPINSVLKEYALSYLYRELYKDKIGANNNVDTTQDKYLTLYEIHDKECERLRKYITQEVIEGIADTANELSYTVTLVRG